MDEKIDKSNVEDIFELPRNQQGMLFHYLKDEHSTSYNSQVWVEIEAPFNHDLIKKSIQQVQSNNEVLRSVFRWKGVKKPLQIILREISFEYEYLDLTDLEESKQNEHVQARSEKFWYARFDLTKLPLRILIAKRSDHSFMISVTHHHILYDGWSSSIFINEILQRYNHLHHNSYPDVHKPTYKKVYQALRQKEQSEDIKKYWSTYLFGYKRSTLYPKTLKGEIRPQEPDRQQFIIDSEDVDKLSRLSRRLNVTVSNVLQTAWAILLGKYNYSNDVLFGTVVSGRPTDVNGVEKSIGMYVNTIPVRITFEDRDTLADLVTRTNRNSLESKEYQFSSLSDIQEYAEQGGELLDHIFVFQNYPITKNIGIGNDAEKFHIKDFGFRALPNYDLAVVVVPDDNFTVNFFFKTERYSASTIEKVKDHFRTLISLFARNEAIETISISNIDVLGENVRDQHVVESNLSDISALPQRTLLDLFNHHVRTAPHSIAARDLQSKLTYKELDDRSNALAEHLSKRTSDSNVAFIRMTPSTNMVVAILGVFKSGLAFIPLDPEQFSKRQESIIEQFEDAYLITSKSLSEKIPFQGTFILMEDLALAANGIVNQQVTSQDHAYIIYTSGTSGNPKGVQISHGNLFNYVDWFVDFLGIDHHDRSLLTSSFAFDLGYSSIFPVLGCGGELSLFPVATYQSPDELLDIIENSRITYLKFTPSLFSTLVGAATLVGRDLRHLRYILLGGESIQPSDIATFREYYSHVQFINHYGPSETTIGVVAQKITDYDEFSNHPTIGRPIARTNAYILDQQGWLAPFGAVGQLVISGASVGQGYFGHTALTKEKFFRHIHLGERNLYKTGDLARWLSNGMIEFLGRADNQVKIRGYRIELRDVEAHLTQHEKVNKAIVIAKGTDTGRFIVGYYISSEQISNEELYEYLKEKLPDYMIPTFLVPINHIPLTRNNKLDVSRLPEPEIKENSNDQERLTPTQKNLRSIWAEILQINEQTIGLKSSFLNIGGHSLKAIALANKLHKHFEVKVSLNAIFEYVTLEQMSHYVQQLGYKEHLVIEPAQVKDYYTLSSAQRRMFFLHEFDRASLAYNMPFTAFLWGKLDKARLNNAFKRLIDRHESLRTYFELIDGKAVQKISDAVDFELTFYSSKEGVDALIEKFVRPFDLSHAPLVRVDLVNLSTDEHLLMIDMHHIVTDGTSRGILVHDLMALYDNKELVNLNLQYKDYSEWHNEYKKQGQLIPQREFWLKEFADEPPVLELPTDFKRPKVKTYRGRGEFLILDAERTALLRSIADNQGVTLFMLLLSVFNVLLSKLSNTEDIVIGSPVAGREHSDLDKVVGLFINTLALRNFPQGELGFDDFLKTVKHRTIQCFENQAYQFEDLVDELKLEREMSRHPLFDIMFTLQNFESAQLTIPDITLTQYVDHHKVSKFDLVLIASEFDKRIEMEFQYCTDLFTRTTIIKFISYFEAIIDQISQNITIPLKEIDVLSKTETNQLLFDFNNTTVSFPDDKTVIDLFDEQYINCPDHPALIFRGDTLTYKDFHEHVNALAMRLMRTGVKNESIVGIMCERSFEMMIGIYAILKAGGAYLPIDPSYPRERISYILDDSQTQLILTDADYDHLLDGAINTIRLDLNAQIDSEQIHDFKSLAVPDGLAYVIYTSGSTGRPKGVMIEHRSLMNRINWMQKTYPLTSEDVILHKTPIVFDVSVWELFWWSQHGLAMCLLEPGAEKDPQKLCNTIVKNKVTTLHFVPPMLQAFLDYVGTLKDLSELDCVKYVFASGEALLPQQVNTFNRLLKKVNNTKLVNLYGPTEATIDVSYFNCFEKENYDIIPIGKPIDNINLVIVDKFNRLVPSGVSGELCISGIGLARGYLNNVRLTQDKFVHSPFKHWPMMYRTGDAARWLPDGNIEYLGRLDHQVKLRGYRIELGEVESQLNENALVETSIVTMHGSNSGDKKLVAYVVPHKKASPLVSRQVHLESQTRDLMSRKTYTLPNGLPVYHLNRNETEFLYQEIFVQYSYLQNGIHLQEGDCVVDVGANIGMLSVFLSQLFDDIKIYSFEPIPEVFDVLTLNSNLYLDKVNAFNIGLSNTPKQVNFSYYPNATILSTYGGNAENVKKIVKAYSANENLELNENDSTRKSFDEIVDHRVRAEEVTCTLRTLSQIIEENGIEKIDLLKIDVERSELDVINGIKPEHWSKIKQIVIEVHDIDNGLQFVRELLGNRGFKTHVIQEEFLRNTDIYSLYAIHESCDQPPKRDVTQSRASLAPAIHNKEMFIGEIRTALQSALPGYMIPGSFVLLDKLPITRSGKIDRKALPDPELTRTEDHVLPSSNTEKKLLAIWAELLEIGLDSISTTQSFFELGGHSLKAIVLVNQILKVFRVQVSLTQFFENQNIRNLGRVIDGLEKNTYSSIKSVAPAEYYKTSSAQQRMYFLYEFERDSVAYNIFHCVEMRGKLEKERLRQAFRKLISRHESLRTSLEVINNEIVQRIHQNIDFDVDFLASTSDVNGVIKDFIKPFDLRKAPLIQVGVVEISEEAHVLILNLHHIISDGISVELLVKDFLSIYEAKELPPLQIDYKDFADWQRSPERQDQLNDHKTFWLNYFANEPTPLELPTDFSRPLIKNHNGNSIVLELSKGQTLQLREMARKQGVTIFMLLQSVYCVLLNRLSNQTDIVIGSPVGGRSHADLDKIVGLFMNTIAIRHNVDGQKSFTDLLQDVKENVISCLDHQYYHFEDLVDALHLQRDTSRSPLYDVMFVYQQIDKAKLSIPGFEIMPYKSGKEIAKFDLTLTVAESKEDIQLSFNYSTSLFKQKTIQQFATYYHRILSFILEDPGQRICKIDMFSLDEFELQTKHFNQTKVEYPREDTIVSLFRRKAAIQPEKVAVHFEGVDYTYRDIDDRSNALANYMLSVGVKDEDLVGILLERSQEMIISLLAVLKAGCAYVPIDPSYPIERIRYMIEDSGLKFLISSVNQEWITKDLGTPVMILDVNSEAVKSQSFENVDRVVSSRSLCYVIYTSGSTGRPKGIMIEHRSVVNFIHGVSSKIDLRQVQSLLSITTVSFDIFVLETWVPLTTGSRIVLANTEEQSNLGALSTLIKTTKVDAIQLTPSRLELLLQGSDHDLLKDVQILMIGGEAFPSKLLQVLQKHYRGKIYNMYGPTETTVWSTIQDLTDKTAIDIGKPINNTKVYILNKSLGLQPIGVTGELYIGGAGLARGYLNNQSLTNERFIACPFEPDKILYKTGDMAKYLEDGSLEYVGRVDHQIKIRGHRIELAEIETHLLSFQSIDQAVVTSWENENNKSLVAYFTGIDWENVREVRKHLAAYLPEYMIPSYFVQLVTLPLTPNGKIDRKALPKPTLTDEEPYIGPSNEIEEKLVNIWSEVLNIDRQLISVTRGFFELGGNSLKSILLISRINRELKIELKVKDLFTKQTIRNIAELISINNWLFTSESSQEERVEFTL